MGMGTVLDNSFRIYRRNFVSICIFALGISGVVSFLTELGIYLWSGGTLVDSLLNSYTSYFESYLNSDMAVPSFSPAFNWGLLIQFLTFLFIIPIITGGITNIAGGYIHGARRKPSEWFTGTLRLYGKLFVTGLAQLLVLVASILAVLFPMLVVIFIFAMFAMSGVPALIIVMTVLMVLAVLLLYGIAYFWTTLVYAVFFHEGRYGFGAVGRAFSLYFRSFWKNTFTFSFGFVMILFLDLAWSLLSSYLLTLVTLPVWLTTLVTTFLSSITLPLLPILAVLLYLDGRMRREGYDLELRAGALARARR